MKPKRVLILAATTGYQTRAFEETAKSIGLDHSSSYPFPADGAMVADGRRQLEPLSRSHRADWRLDGVSPPRKLLQV